MNVSDILSVIRRTPELAENIEHWKTLPASEGSYEPFPEDWQPRLKAALEARGIEQLYSHQRQACDALTAGEDLVIVTPTASGKSLCYNAPVLNTIAGDDTARALYVFPTKALSQDQVAEFNALVKALGGGIAAHTYDGDTPPAARRNLRARGHVVVTNPYMLHTGILPQHQRWLNLFQGLRYVVIDEAHIYKGVFGSHLANVVRRLQRICAHYGSDPQFVLCSATIADPGAVAKQLIGRDCRVIDEDGSPKGEKHFLLYNPPIVNQELGLRARAIEEVRRLGALLAPHEIQAIYFARSRNNVEVLTKYLKDAYTEKHLDPSRVCAYRGGYLPELRREIERGLRSGELSAVVSTNALELGVDIGSLDGCILAGYPGSLAATFQQAGRAGRRAGVSAAILVARSTAMDQYIMRHPDYLFEKSKERTVLDPDNPIIFANQLKCAAFELPFREGELFGGNDETGAVLRFFENEARILIKRDGQYWWMAEAYPAQNVSLNATDIDNFVIYDIHTQKIIGEIDRFGAMTMIHEEAIYGHQGDQYYIEKMDWEGRRVHARKVNPDYYTEAETETELKILRVDEHKAFDLYDAHLGEVNVKVLVPMYKKIKFYTGENIGAGEIHLPPEEKDTSGFWFTIHKELAERVGLYSSSRSRALGGLGRLLRQVTPLFVRCDPGDISVEAQVKSPHFEVPVVYVYDNVPGGVGLSDAAYECHRSIFEAILEIVRDCECGYGCPACVGPTHDLGTQGKGAVVTLLEGLLEVGG
ncbi:MAG: DEAD/DEAH box helicase [Planctomycetota bacterium]